MSSVPTTPPRFAQRDFRIGQVISRALSVLSRNFLTFVAVTTVAYLPTLLVYRSVPTGAPFGPWSIGGPLVTILLIFLLSLLSQAIVLYGAFEDLRGRPVRLIESLRVALGRFLPIIGMVLVVILVVVLGFLLIGLLVQLLATAIGPILTGILVFLLVVGGLLYMLTVWFAGIPVCVVEGRGPVASLLRSASLTKGHRWKIFGLGLLLVLAGVLIGTIGEYLLAAVAGNTAALIGHVIWNGIWGAFFAIAVVVGYRDLRAAKEGIDIDQIAAVFD